MMLLKTKLLRLEVNLRQTSAATRTKRNSSICCRRCAFRFPNYSSDIDGFSGRESVRAIWYPPRQVKLAAWSQRSAENMNIRRFAHRWKRGERLSVCFPPQAIQRRREKSAFLLTRGQDQAVKRRRQQRWLQNVANGVLQLWNLCYTRQRSAWVEYLARRERNLRLRFRTILVESRTDEGYPGGRS